MPPTLPKPTPVTVSRRRFLGALVPGLICWPLLVAGAAVNPHIIMEQMAKAYDPIHDYTALFLKRERINGALQQQEVIELRFQEPFKIYMAWREPYTGRIVTYVKGENDDKMLVNPGGLLGFVNLSLSPSSLLATRNSHHTILEAGLQKTIDLIMRQYRRGMREGLVTLAFRGHDQVDERPAYHLEFICQADKAAGYYAARGEVWVDKEHYLPTRLHIYNWNNELYAAYEYHDLALNPGLGPEAFQMSAVPSPSPPLSPPATTEP